MSQLLFDAYQLGDLTLKNRLVMAPMTRNRAIDHIPNNLMAEYYRQRSGAGLIITEGTSPSPDGLGYPRIPGVFSDRQAAQWALTTEAVHKHNSRIFIQLMHTGRVSHPLNMPEGSEVLAPSAIAIEGSKMYTDQEGEQPFPTPKEMTQEDIQTAKRAFVKAAENAMNAGFDGVELHAANGYLLEQFISPLTNQRSDQYGGNIENRLRFVLEVAQATANAISSDRVGIRVSPYGVFNDMGHYDELDETYRCLAQKLNEMGLVYLHLVDHEAMGAPEVPDRIRKILRDEFKNTFILSGGYDGERAEADLQANKGDLVAMGRPWLANPDLAERIRAGAPLNDPDQDTFYTPGPEGYTDYPVMSESESVA